MNNWIAIYSAFFSILDHSASSTAAVVVDDILREGPLHRKCGRHDGLLWKTEENNIVVVIVAKQQFELHGVHPPLRQSRARRRGEVGRGRN